MLRIQTLETATETKMIQHTWKENLYEIFGENTTTISKQNLLDHNRDTWMTDSYFGNVHEAILTIFIDYSKTYAQK